MIEIKVRGVVARLIKNQKQPFKDRDGEWSSDYIVLKCDPRDTKRGSVNDYIPIEVYSSNNSNPYYMNMVKVGYYCEFELFVECKNWKAPEIEIRSFIQKNNVTKRTPAIYPSFSIKTMNVLVEDDVEGRAEANDGFKQDIDGDLPF